ncbi:MAG: beta-ketoacyl-ACP synthase III [Spirochaetaceae bacterium]
MKAYIKSIGAHVPDNRVSNDDLAHKIDTSDEWIRSHTGIGNRHICGPDEAASDLAVAAAERALERADISREEIDLVIVATASADYPGFPATASIVQDRLGLKAAGAFDLAAGCTGFVYGLETACNMLVGGRYRNILLIGVEVLSKIANWEDRNTCVLFGDGAGAAIISKTDNTENGLIDSILRSEGSGAMHLIRKAGGSREPIVYGTTPKEDILLHMDGRQVYNFAVRVNTEIISELLEANKFGVEDVKRIIPHQANIRIIQAAAKRLKIPMEKFFVNIEEYANTSAASIPIALNEYYESGELERGDLLLFVGFGAGLSYGGNLLRW